MREVVAKLLSGPGPETPHEYNHVFDLQQTTGPSRLVLAPRRDHVDLLLSLIEAMPEPLGLLYVLVVPRSEREPGRYQSEEMWDRAVVASFLERFRDALELDGRHHLWIASDDGSMLVYDNHQVIYAYGDLDAFEDLARTHGLVPGDVVYPAPHVHCYHERFDADEAAILDEYAWIRYDLVEEHDDP